MYTRLTETNSADDFMRQALDYSDKAFLRKQQQQQNQQAQNTYNFSDDSEIQVIDLEKEVPVSVQNTSNFSGSKFNQGQLLGNRTQDRSISEDGVETKNIRFNIEINIKINVRS